MVGLVPRILAQMRALAATELATALEQSRAPKQ